jgi:2-amino-4-hydroxy-6-hydroxymethyldihydropteridine diphosphokinase
MHIAYLLVGGNLGNRADSLQQARNRIEQEGGRIKAASHIYETAAWGNTQQAPFLNQVLVVETALEAQDLMRQLLSIEHMMGRIREERYGPRKIDIDILLFDNEIHDQPELRIPHPEMTNRRFALVPLAELVPNLVHPVSGKTVAQLLAECPDQLAVQKI